MEKNNLPSEVIGIILRLVEDDTRGVVLASATSSQWRAAMRTYLSRISLSADVRISARNLDLLLNSCPYIEQLMITDVKLIDDHPSSIIDFTAPCLTTACISGLQIDEFILRADKLEELELCGCSMGSFLINGNNNPLRALKIDGGHIGSFGIGENNKSLEVLEVRDTAIMWPDISQLISNSAPNLEELTLWKVVFNAECRKLASLNCLGARYPNLIRLSLSFGVDDDMVRRSVEGGVVLEKVEKVAIGADLESDVFLQWLAAILKMCPNTRELVLRVSMKELRNREAWDHLGSINSRVPFMLLEHPNMVYQFVFDDDLCCERRKGAC